MKKNDLYLKCNQKNQTMIQFLIILGMFIQNPNELVTVHDFTYNSITGEQVQLSDFKDKVVLIVNTASKCGFTSQYQGLQELHDLYADKGFVVLGFPSDNFGGQEFGNDDEILEFCERNFGVNFPLFTRTDVRGDNKSELFSFLTSAENPDFTGEINWNFEKFLIDQNGHLIRRFRSQTKPNSIEVKSSIEMLLGL